MRIGPTFGDELWAAGLGGLPIAWIADGEFNRSDLTPEQSAALDAVIAAHDPDQEATPPRDLAAEFDRLKGALVDKAIVTEAEVTPKKPAGTRT